MIKMMEDLLALQELQWRKGKGGREQEIEALRKAIPNPLLDHYDRLQVRGKKGVAILRNGVCTECHMRVPIGTLVTLAHGQDVQLCGNCGRYLYLPVGESVAGAKPATTGGPPRSRLAGKLTVPAA
jgi:predicted  nucleic acid-binding Zn-ribbon protein